MKLELTPEQQMVQAMAREFAEHEVRPIAADLDREARFPHETVKRMGELGLLGIAVPEAWGGSGADTVSYAVALVEVANACASHAVVMSVNNSLYCDPILKFGTDAQREEFLSPRGGPRDRLLRPDRARGGIGRDQPEHAGRPRRRRLRAQRPQALRDQRARVVGRPRLLPDRPRAGLPGISAFLVRKGTPGFLVPKTEDKLGLRASDTAEFLFTDCRVPAARGSARRAWASRSPWPRRRADRHRRPGPGDRGGGAYERARAYALERKAFGVPIGHHQMVQWMLADMATAIEAARLLTLRAAWLKDAGQPYGVAPPRPSSSPPRWP